MDEGYTTTPLDFTIFKREARAWIKKFGLVDWAVEFGHEGVDKENSRASCHGDYAGRLCEIRLDPEWDRKATLLDIKRVAFHEVCELLIMDLSIISRTRFGFSFEDIECAEHKIIRTLENVVFEPLT